MAKRLMVSTGIQFDSIDKLKAEAQSILNKVSSQINLKVGNIDISNLDKTIDKINNRITSMNKNSINLNGMSSNKTLEELAKTISEIQNLSKYKIELMSDGQVKVITDINNELNETIRTIKNLNNGNTSVSITGDIDKNKKEVYSEITKLQKIEYDLKTKLLSADGEYAKVLEEQIQYTQQLNNLTKEDIDKTNLSDERMYNEILKERSSLEDKLNRAKSKIETNSTNKFNQDLLKQNDYLDKVITKLKTYKQSVDNSGGGKPTQQSALSNEINKEISKMEELKNQNNLLGIAEKNRINSTVSQMRVQTNELVKYESSFSNLFKRMGMYALGGGIIYNGIAEVKKGISDIVELDSAMRDLTKVAKATQEELDGFTKVANSMAKEVGTSTENIIKATEYYSKLGYAIEEATARASEAVVFKNVGDFESIDEASKALITISKGFDLNSLEDITRIMDVANKTGNEYSSSTKDVAIGLQKMGNALFEAGNSYEQAVGLFVAGNASIQDADVVGNALKTITMRLRGMETEIDETSVPVSKLRDEIKQLTSSAGQMVDIMVDDNTFKSTYDQMTELAEVYPKLTDGQRAYLQYVIAGQRQGNIFSGTMQNIQEGIEAYNSALDSSGSSYEEQSRYMDSIEGKINQFSETVKSLWVEGINSDSIKSIVDIGTASVEVFGKMANMFGLLPATIGVATTALVVFNKEMYLGITQNMPLVGSLNAKIGSMSKTAQNAIGDSIINAFSKLSDSMTNANVKAKTLAAGNVVLSTSLKAVEIASALATGVMTLGLSFAITALITHVTKLISSLKLGGKSMEDVETQANSLSQSLDDISKERELSTQYEKIGRLLQDSNTTQSESVELQKQLDTITQDLISSEDEYYWILKNGNLKLDERLEKMEQIRQQKLFDEAKELEDGMPSQNDIEKKVELLQGYISSYNDIKDAIATGIETGNFQNLIDLIGVSDIEEANQVLKETKNKINELDGEVLKWNSSILKMSEANYETNLSNVKLKNGTEDFIKTMNDATNATNENTKAKEQNSEVGGTGETAGIKELAKAYSDTIQEMENLYSIQEKINEAQSITPELAMKLLDLYPELGSRISSLSETQEFLNQKIGQSASAQQDAYSQMVANDNSYYTSKVANDDAIQQNFNQLLSSFVTNSGKAYQTDLSLYSNLNQLKAALTDQYGESVASLITNFVAGQSSGYDVDLDNTVAWAKSKSQILQQLDKNITKIENRLATSVSKISSMDITDDNMTDAMKQYQANARKLAQLKTQEAEIQTEFNKVVAGFKGYTPTFSGSDFSGTSGGSSSGGSSGTSSAEKEIENMESLYDRYLEVENALKKLDNELAKNNNLMEQSTGKERIAYLNKEIELIKKQEVAYRNKRIEEEKELSEIRKRLNNSGFNFNKDGEIANYERINALTSWANSLKGTAKENAKNSVESIYEDITKYNKLLLEEIPELGNKILELQNDTVDTQKEILNVMEEMVDETLKNIEKSMDKSIDKIDKKISNMDFNIEITGGLNATNTTIFKANIIKLQKEKLDALNKTLVEYSKITAVSKEQQDSLNEKMEETKQQIVEQQQELRKLAGAYEEYGLELLTSPYEDKIWQKGTQQMNKVDLELQTTQDKDTANRIALTKQKLELQKSMVEDTRAYIEKLRNTTTKTTEGYQLLIQKLKEAEEELYSQQSAYNALNKELENFYKEKLNSVASVENQISEIIKKNAEDRIKKEKEVLDKSIENDKKRIESKKKALQEEKDLYNKQYSEENYESGLNEERNKLLQIQAEIDKLQFANDRESNQKLESLMKEYEQQQKVINDKISDHQNQVINDRFEEEQKILDKELEEKQTAYEEAIEDLDKKLETFLDPENLTKLVAIAIESGFVEILGQTTDLNDAMQEMLKKSEVGVANLNIKFNDWLDKLTEIKSVAGDISSLMKNAGLDSDINLSSSKSRGVQTLAIDMGGINIDGNVDRDTLSDIDRMFKKQQEEIISVINKRLSGAR